MPRLFYALWPTPRVRAALARAALAVDLREALAIRADNLHLTLVFLGNVDDATCGVLQAAVSPLRVPAFRLDIARTGWWRSSQVAWLAPLDPPAALDELVAGLTTHVANHACRLEARPFAPHVTIGRKVRRAPRATGDIAVHWPVADYALVVSEHTPTGSSYRVLARWPLAG